MQRKSSGFDTIVVMTLMCAFIVISLLLVATGANLYRAQRESSQSDYELRTALAYVSNRVRQSREEMTLIEQQDVQALVFPEQIGGEEYLTYIYFYNGTLNELFTRSDSEFTPQLGQSITQLGAFGFSVENGLLTVNVSSTSGQTRTLSLYAG